MITLSLTAIIGIFISFASVVGGIIVRDRYIFNKISHEANLIHKRVDDCFAFTNKCNKASSKESRDYYDKSVAYVNDINNKMNSDLVRKDDFMNSMSSMQHSIETLANTLSNDRRSIDSRLDKISTMLSQAQCVKG